MNYHELTGYDLSVCAAVAMWGPAPALSRQGEPQYGGADDWRIVSKSPLGFYAFRPDCNLANTEQFSDWLMARCLAAKIPVNFTLESTPRQHPAAPVEKIPSAYGPVYMVGQAYIYRASYAVGPAWFHDKSRIYLHENIDKRLAWLIAALAACEGLGISGA